MGEDMVDTEARGKLRLRPTVVMEDTVVATVEDMVDTEARGKLRLRPTVVMEATVVATVEDMVDIVARGRLRLTVAMVDTVVDTEATEALDTEDKQQYFLLN